MKDGKQKKHVVITGGAGFIGSHLCDELLARGYAVTAVDNFVTGARENLLEAQKSSNFALLEHDVSHPLDLKTASPFAAEFGVFGVLHFACPASPVDFDRIPMEILAVDSYGTQHSTDWAIAFGARYVLASTSEVYGDPLVHPQREDYWGNVNPIGPRACYDETKRFAEAYVSSRRALAERDSRHRPLNAAIVRIFNTYGPRMRPDDGRIVPEFCRQALHGQTLTLHGDGMQTRSFCYVTDLVDGILKCFESSHFGPINLGNPVEHTVTDFAKAVVRLARSGSELKHTPARTDDPRQRRPDITRAREWLEWEPHVDLETGLTKTIDYFRKCASL